MRTVFLSMKHLLLAVFFLLSSSGFAQVAQKWVARYTGAFSNLNDQGTDVTSDANGNVYVTGASEFTGHYEDIVTIKYDKNGLVLWEARFNGAASGSDKPQAIAVDAAGNVYVAGHSTSAAGFIDYVTLKYNAAGALQWEKRYAGPGGEFDGATDLAVDASGNVYVTGQSWSTNYDYATIKYSPTGTELWVKRYNGPAGGDDSPTDLALDGSGNVYITGSSAGAGTALDMTTLKYNSAGTLLWEARHDGPLHDRDGAHALTLDGSGNVYVTGFVSTIKDLNEEGNATDYATVKYNAAGVKQWASTYNGADSDQALAIAVDGSGNVYITGFSGTLEEDPNNAYATVKYTAGGSQQWAARIGVASGNAQGRATDLAVDGSGNVYVTGGAPGTSALDYVTAKYSTGGVQQWLTRYNGPGNSDDLAQALHLDANGNVYLTGQSWGGGTSFDFATFKLNNAGQQQWIQRYGGPGSGADFARDIATDASGNVYVTGSSPGNTSGRDFVTLKYHTNGNLLWEKRFNGTGNGDDGAEAVFVDGAGNVYVTGGSTGAGSGVDFITIKYDKAGAEKWVKRYTSTGSFPDGGKDIAVDKDGNVYVTGTGQGASANGDFTTIKYDLGGNRKWVKTYNGPGNNEDRAVKLALDGSGNIYISGQSNGGGYNEDYATLKYDKEGNQKWVKRYDGPGSSLDNVYDLAVDGSGNVYVTGQSFESGSGSAYATVKYNTSGAQQWVKRYHPGTGSDVATALAVDASGNIYVTGNSNIDDSDHGDDFATIKYNPGGTELWVKRYDGPDHSTDQPADLALDAGGNVYVTGMSYNTHDGLNEGAYATVKYSTAGVQQWARRYDGPVSDGHDAATAIAVDGSGNAYVTGNSEGGTTGTDWATIKYAPAGSATTYAPAAAPSSADIPQVAARFRLSHAPNPVATTARIQYELPSGGRVTIKVYDLQGRETATIITAAAQAGTYNTLFDASRLPTGLYHYRLTLQTGSQVLTQTGRMSILR
ncbi:SBBP repeat-containing protein [Paraflavisolibacter sp. H34]|uniref:SBBP repeat-containing protein n=1 Tax=Huijunlia imazamoxiresistens TaxID=3127457 RepID=UPI003018222D